MAGLRYDSGVATVDPEVAPRIVPEPDRAQVDAELAVAEAAAARNAFPDAIRAMTRAVIHDPVRAESFGALSVTLLRARQAAAAGAACRAALALAPDNVVRARLAVISQALGDFEGAANTWREVLLADDADEQARGRLAVLLYYLEQYEEAWTVIHEADVLGQEVPPQLRLMLAEELPEP